VRRAILLAAIAAAAIAGCGRPEPRPRFTHESTSKEARRAVARAAPVAVATGPVSRTRVEEAARPWFGAPYRYGGESRYGIDCSALTQNVIGDLGAELPRTVREQAAAGAPVSAAGIAPGDLVFFRLSSTTVDHVGVALDANRFVHSAASRGVVVDHLMDGYFSRRFAGARRVLAEGP
jgi:cell wall-associated NlpC family hydrolase